MDYLRFLSAAFVGSSRNRPAPSRRGVAKAPAAPASTLVPLATGQECWIEGLSTFVVHCASGFLWVTSPQVCCDVVLSGGERLEMLTRGKLLIGALSESALWLPADYRLDDGARQLTSGRIVRSAR